MVIQVDIIATTALRRVMEESTFSVNKSSHEHN